MLLPSMQVLRQSDKRFLQTLENCIRFGKWCLIENVGESIDAALEPILLQQTFKQVCQFVLSIHNSCCCVLLGYCTVERHVVYPLRRFRGSLLDRFPPVLDYVSAQPALPARGASQGVLAQFHHHATRFGRSAAWCLCGHRTSRLGGEEKCTCKGQVNGELL